MQEINYNTVYDFLCSLLKSPIKARYPNGYDACLDCGIYYHHKLIYCTKCGKKIESVREMSWANFQTIVHNSGSGVINTIQGIMSRNFDADFLNNRDRYNKLFEIYEQIRKGFPNMKILIASVFTESDQKFFLPNADEYYDKSEDATGLIKKIEKLMNID